MKYFDCVRILLAQFFGLHVVNQIDHDINKIVNSPPNISYSLLNNRGPILNNIRTKILSEQFC